MGSPDASEFSAWQRDRWVRESSSKAMQQSNASRSKAIHECNMNECIGSKAMRQGAKQSVNNCTNTSRSKAILESRIACQRMQLLTPGFLCFSTVIASRQSLLLDSQELHASVNNCINAPPVCVDTIRLVVLSECAGVDARDSRQRVNVVWSSGMSNVGGVEVFATKCEVFKTKAVLSHSRQRDKGGVEVFATKRQGRC